MNPLVAEYLARLDAALSGLPPARRIDVVDDIRTHIEAELSGRDDVSDADVRTLLDRIGPPSAIAAAALADDAGSAAEAAFVDGALKPGPRFGGLELAAVLLLVIGGFLYYLGWLVGVVLLWASPAWRIRDKVIGTLVIPGGVAPLFFGVLPIPVAPAFWALIAAPILAASWLVWTANRHRARPELRREYAGAVS